MIIISSHPAQFATSIRLGNSKSINCILSLTEPLIIKLIVINTNIRSYLTVIKNTGQSESKIVNPYTWINNKFIKQLLL